MAGKLNIANLKEEEKEKLRQYVESLKAIKKEISKLVNKGKSPKMPKEIKEKKIGGNNSTGLYYKLK